MVGGMTILWKLHVPNSYGLWEMVFEDIFINMELLFSSVKQVEVMVSNLMCRPRLCYWSKLHYNLAQRMFEGIFWFLCSRFPKNTVFCLSTFQAIVLNLKFGLCHCYWGKMPHILAQYRFESKFCLYAAEYPKSTEKYF